MTNRETNTGHTGKVYQRFFNMDFCQISDYYYQIIINMYTLDILTINSEGKNKSFFLSIKPDKKMTYTEFGFPERVLQIKSA